MPSSSFWIPSPESMDISNLRLDLQPEFVLAKESGQQNHYASVGAALGIWKHEVFKAEFNLDYSEPIGTKLVDSLQLGAKLSYLLNWEAVPQLGLGIRNFSFGADGNYQVMYLVTDIHLLPSQVMRLGLFNGKEKLLVDSSGEESNYGLMLAYFYPLQGDWGKLGAEWISGKNPFSYLWLGTHFRFSESADTVIAYGIPNDNSYKQRLMFKVSLYY